jgi:photosystem II stability/assembly factor-like uncharacterized protein
MIRDSWFRCDLHPVVLPFPPLPGRAILAGQGLARMCAGSREGIMGRFIGLAALPALMFLALCGCTEDAEDGPAQDPPHVVYGTIAQAGIEGGRVTALGKTSSSSIFAGTYRGGIFHWDAGPWAWVRSDSGFNRDLAVSAIAVDPNDPFRVLVGTGGGYAGGIWLSTNGGDSWSCSSTGLGSLHIGGISALPGATAPSSFVAGTAAGLFRSDDGGATWTAVTDLGLCNLDISGLAVISAATLFASTSGGGVHFYNGSAYPPWAQRSAGLSDMDVTALAFHPGIPTLYAGTRTAGVFLSTDYGNSWTQANTSQLPSLEVLALAVDPNDSTRVWVGTEAGLRYSANGGASWAAPGTAPSDPAVLSLLQDPVYSDTVFAGGFSGGVSLCTNATGARVFSEFNQGLVATDVRAVAPDPHTAGAIYAGGGFDLPGETSFGIRMSLDSGVNWSVPTLPPPGGNVSAIAPNPVTAGRAYVGVRGAGVWFTSNSGGTWSQVWTPSNPDVLALEVVSTGPDTLLAGCLAGGAWRTVDGGTGWTAVSGIGAAVTVHDFSFEPGSTTDVWAATSAGVYRTTDGGATWTSAGQPAVTGAGGTPVNAEPVQIQVDPDPALNPVVVYAGTESHGIFVSADGGTTWRPSARHVGPSVEVRVWVFCARTTAPYGVYAATSAGLCRTRSAGADWSPIHDGDPTIIDPLSRRITIGRAITLAPTDPSVLWVATGGRGVIRITLHEP